MLKAKDEDGKNVTPTSRDLKPPSQTEQALVNMSQRKGAARVRANRSTDLQHSFSQSPRGEAAQLGAPRDSTHEILSKLAAPHQPSLNGVSTYAVRGGLVPSAQGFEASPY